GPQPQDVEHQQAAQERQTIGAEEGTKRRGDLHGRDPPTRGRAYATPAPARLSTPSGPPSAQVQVVAGALDRGPAPVRGWGVDRAAPAADRGSAVAAAVGAAVGEVSSAPPSLTVCVVFNVCAADCGPCLWSPRGYTDRR